MYRPAKQPDHLSIIKRDRLFDTVRIKINHRKNVAAPVGSKILLDYSREIAGVER